jgi:hypothetical protein
MIPDTLSTQSIRSSATRGEFPETYGGLKVDIEPVEQAMRTLQRGWTGSAEPGRPGTLAKPGSLLG